MKVPTFHKFGITKAQIDRAESKDKKISDILTHHLTIAIGLSLGVVVYIIYYNEVKPSTFIQIVMQIFLFASMGVLCVGIPAVLFKLAEMFYFKHIKARQEDHKSITKYTEERDEFDFWKIRWDYSFWKILSGLSFDKEVMNIYMHLGYEVMDDMFSESDPGDAVMKFDEKLYYFSFHTKITELSDTAVVDKLLNKISEKGIEELMLFSQKGFTKQFTEYSKGKPINLFDINGIIKVVRTVKK